MDVTDAEAIAKALVDGDGKVFFKKRVLPTEEPVYRFGFVTPVSAPSDDGFATQGQYFAYVSPDAQTEAAWRKEAERYFIRRTTDVEHDDDEYGRYSTTNSTDLPIAQMRSLRDPYSFGGLNGEVIVSDGKIQGFVMCFAFCGYKNADDEYMLTLHREMPKGYDPFAILPVDGPSRGADRFYSSDHSGRDFTDSETRYTVTTKPCPDSSHMEWK